MAPHVIIQPPTSPHPSLAFFPILAAVTGLLLVTLTISGIAIFNQKRDEKSAIDKIEKAKYSEEFNKKCKDTPLSVISRSVYQLKPDHFGSKDKNLKNDKSTSQTEPADTNIESEPVVDKTTNKPSETVEQEQIPESTEKEQKQFQVQKNIVNATDNVDEPKLEDNDNKPDTDLPKEDITNVDISNTSSGELDAPVNKDPNIITTELDEEMPLLSSSTSENSDTLPTI